MAVGWLSVPMADCLTSKYCSIEVRIGFNFDVDFNEIANSSTNATRKPIHIDSQLRENESKMASIKRVIHIVSSPNEKVAIWNHLLWLNTIVFRLLHEKSGFRCYMPSEAKARKFVVLKVQARIQIIFDEFEL